MSVTSPGCEAEFYVPVGENQIAVQLSGPPAELIGRIEEYNQLYEVYAASEAGTYEFKAADCASNGHRYGDPIFIPGTYDWVTFICEVCGDDPLVENTIVSAIPTAYVTKLNGNKNDLTITITEKRLYGYGDGNGEKLVITKTFSINNNAIGIYDVGGYQVYVDTKGNVQIREIYIVKYPAIVPFIGEVFFVDGTPSIGSKLSINGADPIPVPRRLRLAIGEEVTLEIVPDDPEEYEFIAWTGDIESEDALITFIPEGTLNLSFSLKARYEYATVTLGLSAGNRANPNEFALLVNDQPQALPGSLRVRIGQPYKLEVSTLYPDDYTFLGWSGDHESEDSITVIVPEGNMSMTANFKPEIEYFNVLFTSAGIPRNSFAVARDVTISLNGAAATKLATAGVTQEFIGGRENTVEIKAANDVDFVFKNWTNSSGEVVSTDNPLTFTPTANMTLTANFDSVWQSKNLALTSRGASALFNANAPNTTTWKHANLLDGNIVPNNPTASSLGWSSASLGSANPATNPWFVVNLGGVKTTNRIHLYPRMDVMTTAGGTCYFPTSFTLEYYDGAPLSNFPATNTGATQYTAGGTNMPTAAQVNALNWLPVPGGNNGRFTVASANVPYLAPYVIELPEGIDARYVRVTVHSVNALASDTTSTWYLQLVAIGIYE